ncbi:uroporphyrinogen-III synthase [Alteromonas sp. ASW11-36]|uniref:Uroporphyrinogen-III synthase n=1 Tax=Alteromonas arenosi TaxID=3055817 RepID=A0ABT7SSN3_9ALTE|nr:uroporphyrinogen-III synthase [Alteromonas sp. ASW11-36]MDM7859208.1 uroporphyrinogen-III synthase [Alteromonas sp. ASW11-36]
MIVIIRPEQSLAASMAFFETHLEDCTGVAVQRVVEEPEGYKQLICAIKYAAIDTAIVTSQYAAHALAYALKLNESRVHPKRIICIGHKTARVLVNFKDLCHVPTDATSEGLLNDPILDDIEGRKVGIIKGTAGRTLIHATLAERGAHCHDYPVYRRQSIPINHDNQERLVKASVIIVTNGEAIEQLTKHPVFVNLKQKTWIVPSQRVADMAKRASIDTVHISAGASDAALLKCVNQILE